MAALACCALDPSEHLLGDLAVAQGESHPAIGGGEQDPFAATVEGVARVAMRTTARHDQLLPAAGHRVAVGRVVDVQQAERDG